MKNIDISILKEKPSLDMKAKLIIEPLAPLSMVCDMPGSYYKTLKKPDKKMLCGLFENILGWHIDSADRKRLYKDIKKIRKKQNINFKDKYNGSTYQPLLMDFFEIDGDVEIDEFKGVCFYDDLWSRSFRRSDMGGGIQTHIKGCRNIDYSIIGTKHSTFSKIDDSTSKEKDKEKEVWCNDHFGKFPFFYTTPTTREFFHLDGVFIIKLSLNKVLLDLLSDNVTVNNIGYLGSSEGWIDIKIEGI